MLTPLLARVARRFVPPTRLSVLDSGPVSMLHRPGDQAEARAVLSRDPYLPHLPEVQIGPDSVVLDIGAHIGAFAVTCATRGARVYAVEASPDTVPVLRANVALNQLQERITVSPCALTDHDGAITLYRSGLGARGDSLSSQGQPITGSASVPCTTLAGYLEAHRLAHVDLVKVNAEGAEWGIFLAAPVDVLQRLGCVVICTHEDLMPGRSADELEGHLRGSGMRVRRLPDPGGSQKRPVLVAWR